MRMPPPKMAAASNLVPAFVGPRVPEGTYTFKLIKGKETFEAKVKLVADPRTPHSAEDRKLQQATALEVYDLLADLRGFEAHLAWPVAVDGQDVTALLGGQVQLTGRTGAEQEGPRLVADIDKVLLAWDFHTLNNPTPWHLELERDLWTIRDVSLKGPTSEVKLAAEGGKGRTFIQGTATLDADLGRAIVPGLQRADGVVQVEERRVGTEQELAPDGRFRVEQGDLQPVVVV